MLATLAAVLALAGAPASTNAYCNPALDASALGLTYATTVPGALDNIELGTLACGALLYTSATSRERARIRRLNPSVNFDTLVGVGLQVALHEANHVALDSPDECLVEKTTRGEIDGLIGRLADTGHVNAAEAAATASDAALPPQYHGC
jgi:hypothetical protein